MHWCTWFCVVVPRTRWAKMHLVQANAPFSLYLANPLFLAIKWLLCTTCSLFNGVEDFYYLVQAPFSHSGLCFLWVSFHLLLVPPIGPAAAACTEDQWVSFYLHISLVSCFLVSSRFRGVSFPFSLLFSLASARRLDHFIYFASHLPSMLLFFFIRVSIMFFCLEYFLYLCKYFPHAKT